MRTILEQTTQDLRYALRVIAKSPGLMALAAISLALGIGANTAIHSLLDAILLRAMPVQHPEALAVMQYHTREFPAVARGIERQQFPGCQARDGEREHPVSGV